MKIDPTTNNCQQAQAVEILLVEDNLGDIELTRIAFTKARVANRLHVVRDGQAALDFVYKRGPYESEPRPDIILLDINLPKRSGIEVLEAIKGDRNICSIPIVMLTSSDSNEDVSTCYSNFANSYISKPVKAKELFEVVKQFESFWFTVVKLPEA